MFIETTYMRKCCDPEGIIENTENPQTLATWVYSMNATMTPMTLLQTPLNKMYSYISGLVINWHSGVAHCKVLYFLHSTPLLSFYMDVVLTLCTSRICLRTDEVNRFLMPCNMTESVRYVPGSILKLCVVRGCQTEHACRGGDCGCMSRQLACTVFLACRVGKGCMDPFNSHLRNMADSDAIGEPNDDKFNADSDLRWNCYNDPTYHNIIQCWSMYCFGCALLWRSAS